MRTEELQLLKEQSRLRMARLEQEKEHEKLFRKQMQNNQLRGKSLNCLILDIYKINNFITFK